MPLFSIVTVCKNEEKKIGKTIGSVLDQNFKDYEYIVIDGKSCDRTFDIAKRFEGLYARKSVKYYCQSEEDTGIYSAMNKGISKAKGKWILFLNAGDTFYDKDVLAHVAEKADSSSAVLYGDTLIRYEYPLYKLVKPLETEKITEGMIFCHQSCFVRTDLLKKDRFTEKLKIAADYDFLLRQYLNGAVFTYLGFAVAEYDGEGKSSTDEYTMRKELNAVWHRNRLIDRKTYIHNRDMNRMFYMDGRNIRKLKKIIPGKVLKVIHYIHWYVRLKREGYTKERQ